MKAALVRLLAAFGLAPARHVARLSTEVKKATAGVKHAEDRAAKVRADADGWKRRYDETAGQVSTWKQTAAEEEARGRRLAQELSRAVDEGKQLQAKIDELRNKQHAAGAEMQELRARLREAQRRTASAHEQLMAMEVKLDLLESAVRLLDTRTRGDSPLSVAAQTSAPATNSSASAVTGTADPVSR